MKVKIETINGMHNLAQCRGCNWQCDPFSDDRISAKKVAAECVKHVRQTGHLVVREVANSISYIAL